MHEGMVLDVDPDTIKLCESGLHASMTPDEARAYRHGWLCRVACSGRVIFGRDKLVCSRRVVVEIYTEGLRAA